MSQQSYSLNISELHKRYKQGLLTPESLLHDIKTRIEEYKEYNIWIHLLDENDLQVYLSRLQGKAVDELALYGIPFAIKDNIDLVGVPTTAACPEYSYIPEQSAFAVQRLINAGAIPIGKTNLDQFATGLVGTRSPYGAVKNAFDPDYISGGSSSGSAVALALGQVSFSLGTDTAGSGRVPAAFNNLIGLKATKGRISASGVVPACRSQDCVSLFSLNPDDASTVFEVIDCHDPSDIYSRVINSNITHQSNKKFKVGVPKSSELEFFNNKEYEKLFNDFVSSLSGQDYEIVEIDFTPFKQAANLLYQGPWVAERYAAIEKFIENKSDALYPVTRDIISPARSIDAVDTFNKFYELQQLKKQADEVMEQIDFIITPTAGTNYRIDEVNAEPVQTNSNLGYYTNFMNLLDYVAIAIPAGFNKQGFPFGATLFSKAFTDKDLLIHTRKILKAQSIQMGATEFSWNPIKTDEFNVPKLNTIDIAVCGAHLSGMALNHQLTDKDAVLIKATKTAASYKFYALAGGPPYRPGLIKVKENGASIEVEVWRMPLSNFGKFMLGIPHPLGIGKVLLEDGDEVNSFICEGYAIDDAEEITHFGSWRNYMESISDNLK